jgi:transposase
MTSSHPSRNGHPRWRACCSSPRRRVGRPPRRAVRLDAAALEALVTRYRALAGAGLAGNLYRRTATAKDARRLGRRFRTFEDMILRFATRPDMDIFSSHEAERTIRPVKVQQRSSGGCWRTLEGLAEFALVQSCLSTAAKRGISKVGALRGLFNGQPWLPPSLEPTTG